MPAPDQKDFVGRGGYPGNLIAWQLGEGIFPLVRSEAGSFAGGLIACLLGAAWGFFIGRTVLNVYRESFDLHVLLWLGLVGFPGLLFALYGIGQLIYRKETLIEREKVTVKSMGLRGRREWSEPIPSYRGVLSQRRFSGGGGDRMDKTVYIVKLAHPDGDKEIELFRTETCFSSPPESWEKSAREYAELFSLPLIDETPEGEVATDPKELDFSLVERIRRGTLKARPLDPALSRPGRMVRLEKDGDAFIIKLRAGWTLWVQALGAVVLIGVMFFLLISRAVELLPLLIFLLVVLGLALFGLVTYVNRFRYPEEIAVDADSVWHRRFQKTGDWSTRRIELGEIRKVTVEDDLVISGFREEIRCGGWLSRKQKILVKDLILSLLVEVTRKA